jgi:hypothetical protein
VNTNELDRRKRACGRISVKWPGHGGEQTYLLEDAAALPLLDAEPIRRVRNYHGARHSGGLYWSSTTGTHIPHESVLELQSLILLDYDRNITKISGQPLRFELRLRSSVVRHVPDFLVERNGQLEVIDVKRAEDAAGTEQAERLAATRAACASLGWGYRVMCEPEPLFFSNVQWLSAFRRPLHEPEGGLRFLLFAWSRRCSANSKRNLEMGSVSDQSSFISSGSTNSGATSTRSASVVMQ